MIQKVLFSGEPVTDAQLGAVESALGVRLPDDYRAFLLRYNGGRPKPAGFDIEWSAGQPAADDWRTSSLSMLFPIAEPPADGLVRMNQSTFAGRLPRETLAIGSDAGGNVLLLALGGPHAGKVLFWVKDGEVEEGQTPGYENVGVIAASFGELLATRLR